MKLLFICWTLVACLSLVPAVSGQPRPPQGYVGGPNYQPPTAEQQAKAEQAGQLDQDAAAALHLGNSVQAEAAAREAISINSPDVVASEVLAAALEAQGKDQEALQAYKTVVEHYDRQPRNLLPYAQLLLKSGQWAQAVAIYNEALPSLPDVGPHPERPIVHDGDLITASSHFSPDVPEPAALATALHIARGMIYNSTTGWAGDSLDKEAMAEYGKALQATPDNALANYYYGVGWHKLSPTERVKFGNAEQAKAALKKAASLGDSDVKKMADETLKKSQ